MQTIINEFPLPFTDIPDALQKLLSTESAENPNQKILVSSMVEKNKFMDDYEYQHMVMACIPEKDIQTLKIFDEGSHGVVSFSTPCCNDKGGLYPITNSVSGFDYIVASWGGSSHYSYALSEKVWMTLGLSARAIGNSDQKIIYDDLSQPILNIAEGELSNSYYFESKKNVQWTVRNDYLRKFLWLTNSYGVRSFFYEGYIDETLSVQALLNGQNYYNLHISNNQCEVSLRKNQGRVLIQVYASVIAVAPERCPQQDVHSLVWPGEEAPLTHREIEDPVYGKEIYLDDGFLEKYEKDKIFSAIPFQPYQGSFQVSPSYGGQWALQDCTRIGRNLLKVPIREVYRGLPDSEIIHAHQYSIASSQARQFDLDEEHIVSKSNRFLLELILLGENLRTLVTVLDTSVQTDEMFSAYLRAEYTAEGFRSFQVFQKLAQVAPLKMFEQDFLSRCKTIHEIIGKFASGDLRKLIVLMGAAKGDVKDLGSLKLLQAILNIVSHINEQREGVDGLLGSASTVDFKEPNSEIASLFITNDLRISEAHELASETLTALERLGVDSSSINDGYGKALDSLLDEVIKTFEKINRNIDEIISRG